MKSLIPFDKGMVDFYNMVDDFFRDNGLLAKEGSFKLDVKERDGEYVVEAELPGFKKEEITVEVTEETLNISAKKEEKIDEKKENFIHRERRVEKVRRSVRLAGAKAEGVRARLVDGLLTVTVPKEKKEVPANRVEVE